MALAGTLKDFSLADIFQLIALQKKTGYLTLRNPADVVTVTFMEGTKSLGTSNVDNSGKATFNISTLSKGTHIIKAVYNGDDSFNGSTSGTISQVIN